MGLQISRFAYGFTIAFWGSGLLLINEFGLLHTVDLLEYAVGAGTGFGLLAVATFGGTVNTVYVDGSRRVKGSPCSWRAHSSRSSTSCSRPSKRSFQRWPGPPNSGNS